MVKDVTKISLESDAKKLNNWYNKIIDDFKSQGGLKVDDVEEILNQIENVTTSRVEFYTYSTTYQTIKNKILNGTYTLNDFIKDSSSLFIGNFSLPTLYFYHTCDEGKSNIKLIVDQKIFPLTHQEIYVVALGMSGRPKFFKEDLLIRIRRFKDKKLSGSSLSKKIPNSNEGYLYLEPKDRDKFLKDLKKYLDNRIIKELSGYRLKNGLGQLSERQEKHQLERIEFFVQNQNDGK